MKKIGLLFLILFFMVSCEPAKITRVDIVFTKNDASPSEFSSSISVENIKISFVDETKEVLEKVCQEYGLVQSNVNDKRVLIRYMREWPVADDSLKPEHPKSLTLVLLKPDKNKQRIRIEFFEWLTSYQTTFGKKFHRALINALKMKFPEADIL